MIRVVLLAASLAVSPPTGLHRVGGVELYLHCTGSGRPAVVLDSGLGNDHGYWRAIETGVASTRVCSWDRPGWGRSARHRGSTVTATQVVRDLHGLLHAAGVEGPYVLAGHSIGGLDVQAFARRYPRETAGLVLVDSTPPLAFPRYPPSFRFGDLIFDVGAEARLLRAHPLRGRWPLVVLEHGVFDPGLDPGGWHAYQRGLLRASTNSVLVKALRSGHDIAVDQPKLVVSALREVVAAARMHRALRPCRSVFAALRARCESI